MNYESIKIYNLQFFNIVYYKKHSKSNILNMDNFNERLKKIGKIEFNKRIA